MFTMIIMFFVNLFRRRSEQRSTRRRLSQIDIGNDRNKNIIEYRNDPIESFIQDSYFENAIASGDNPELRNRVVCAAAWQCHRAHRGAVILHCGNYELENKLRNLFNSEIGYYAVNSFNPIYEPFYDATNASQISDIVINSSTNSCKIEGVGRSYIKGLTEFLQITGRRICVNSFVQCMYNREYEDIISMASSGTISEDTAREINSCLAQGQTQFGNIENYFSILSRQGAQILATDSRLSSAINILHALSNNEIISIDIGNSSNYLLINVCLQEIRQAMALGYEFTLFIDNLPARSSEFLPQILYSFSGRCNYIYSSKDVYADTQNASNEFYTLTARAKTVFAFKHNSGMSCDAFSRFFGTYFKREISHTITNSDNYMSYYQLLPGRSNADVYGMQDIERPRVKSDEISAQSMNHVYIMKSGHNGIISLTCGEGDARRVCSVQSRGRLRTSSRYTANGRRISWGIFILLLIFMPPAAFIYTFVLSGRVGKIISAILFIFVLFIYISYFVRILGMK